MALFSFRHSVRTFSAKRSVEARAAKRGQTAAHLKYITRPQAARVVIRERLSYPTDLLVADAAEREAEARKGRVCERFILALPVEATPDQREALVRAFAEALTKSVAGYVAAIHDQRCNDTRNPHAHIAAFDVQVKSGGRGRPRSTIGMARKNAIEETAALWAQIHNRLMQSWGYGTESHISHKSFADRGINRMPQIHEGAAGRHMLVQGKTRAINRDWHHIDSGHTRAEANDLIREINSIKQEAENDRTDRTYRLGSDDEGNRSECRDRREDDGAGSGSSINGAGQPSPPWAATVAVGGNLKGDTIATGTSSRPPFFATSRANAQVPSFAAVHCMRGWGSASRIYHRLMLLRDTLKARLAVRENATGTPNYHPYLTNKVSRSPVYKPASKSDAAQEMD